MVSGVILKKGLNDTQVNEQRKKYGLNKLPEKAGKHPLTIFIEQFKNPLIYIISIAAIVSIIMGELEDAIIITIVIMIDSIIGFAQEYKAETTMQALKHLINPTAKVIRNGTTVNINVADIVPGDLIILNTGEKIPADGELIEAVSLGINEAILTGENEPIKKNVKDKASMGTIILSGRGLMKATATGLATQLGKIAASLSEIKEEQTPLQSRLNKFGNTLTIMVAIISALIFITGVALGKNTLEMIRLSIILAIAAIPEGLLIAVTMILVIGMRMILKKKGLVKKLLAVETLGSVTTIATDKTGTLTEGQMKVVVLDAKEKKMAAYVMALCNNLEDSLEITLWDYVKNTLNINPQELIDKHKRIQEEPFTSEKKYMLTTNDINGLEIGLIKGAPDVVMNYCNLKENEKKKIKNKIDKYANQGLKLLGLAYKESSNLKSLKDYAWAGLVGIEDPIRPSVKASIALCKSAGIKTKIITGDYRLTAEKVAKSLGLTIGPGRVLEGTELDEMTDKELSEIVRDVTVFCRVTPAHKLKIITALQNAGEITAMIGDGVNDAPALKKANIGVTVGGATDVAQETSSIIMLDSNFQTIVNSVREGRIIFDNIKKVAAYVLSNSFAEIIIIFAAFMLGWPAPLTIAQILWIHLICDGPSDIALGFERGEKGIMNEPPKPLNEPILDNKSKFLIIAISALSALLCLIIFYNYAIVNNDLITGQSIIFAVLGIQQLIYIFSYRTLRTSILKAGNFLKNKVLIISVTLGITQQILALYVPFFNDLLKVEPLDINGISLVIGVSFLMTLLVEIVKKIGGNAQNHIEQKKETNKLKHELE